MLDGATFMLAKTATRYVLMRESVTRSGEVDRLFMKMRLMTLLRSSFLALIFHVVALSLLSFIFFVLLPLIRCYFFPSSPPCGSEYMSNKRDQIFMNYN